MGRFTAQVGPGVPTGVYDLKFTRSDGGPPDYPSPVVGNSGAVDQCVLYSLWRPRIPSVSGRAASGKPGPPNAGRGAQTPCLSRRGSRVTRGD